MASSVLIERQSVKIYQSEMALFYSQPSSEQPLQTFPVNLQHCQNATLKDGLLSFLSDENELMFCLKIADFRRIKVAFPLQELLVLNEKELPKLNSPEVFFYELGVFSSLAPISVFKAHVLKVGKYGLWFNFETPVLKKTPQAEFFDKMYYFFDQQLPYVFFFGVCSYILIQEFWNKE